MSFLSSLRLTGSALTAQRLRMDVISNNIANADTTRTLEGGPYQRQTVVFQPGKQSSPFQMLLTRFRNASPSAPIEKGLAVSAIIKDGSPGRIVYEPTHPDANEEGFVEYPNVDTLTEMIDLMSATRAYEANITVANSLKAMAMKGLDIGK